MYNDCAQKHPNTIDDDSKTDDNCGYDVVCIQ